MAELAKQYKLNYFDAKGIVEPMRMMFAGAGKSALLDDVRFPVDFSKYASEGIDGASPAFAEAKKAGTMAANMHRAPTMEVDGVVIGQSSACERLVARRLGLYGEDDIEGALIDTKVEHLADIRKSYQDSKKKDEADKWFAETLKEWAKKLDATLGCGGFAVRAHTSNRIAVKPTWSLLLSQVGSKISWADYRLWHFVNDYFDNQEAVAAGVADCPKILASVKAVASQPAIVEYLANRKQTAM
jgi:hypothetical protein